MSWYSLWSLSFWLFHQYSICIPLLPHSRYMPHQPESLLSVNCGKNCPYTYLSQWIFSLKNRVQ
jgi:hypothetical protein